MRSWLSMVGGLVIWAVHFLGVYALASLADVDPVRLPLWMALALALTAACLAAAALCWLRRSARDRGPLERRLMGASAAMGAVAVVWQSFPLALGLTG